MSGKGRGVIGVGARSALGFDARQVALFARAAKLAPRAYDRDGDWRKQVGTARVRHLDDEVIGTERILRIAAPALEEAVLDAGLDRDEPVRVLLALPEPRRWPDAEEQRLSSGAWLEQLGHAADVQIDRARSQTLRIGHAGFAAALDIALAGESGTVIVGGADSYHHPAVLDDLVAASRLITEEAHGGMVPAEGAAFVVLGARGDRPPLCHVRGAASGKEQDKTWEEPRVAELLTDLIHLVSGTLSDKPVGWALPDVNGERSRGKEWRFCGFRCAEIIHSDATTVTRLAGEMGDLGAATGAMYAAYVIEAFRAGFAPASSALITLASRGGERGVFTMEMES